MLLGLASSPDALVDAAIQIHLTKTSHLVLDNVQAARLSLLADISSRWTARIWAVGDTRWLDSYRKTDQQPRTRAAAAELLDPTSRAVAR
jgi:hypothetical protein